MQTPESGSQNEFVFVHSQRKRPAAQASKPAPAYQSLHFLTLVIQLVYLLLGLLLIVTVVNYVSLPKKITQAKKLQGLLESPTPGINQRELRNAHDQLKAAAAEIKQASETLLISGSAMILFSGVLGLALTGWTYQATSNLLALGVPKLVYSPLIAALGMFLVPLFTAPFILNEVAKGSDPNRLTPYGHRDTGVSLLVIVWWLSMLVGIGATFLAFMQMPTEQQMAAGKPMPTLPLSVAAVLNALSHALGIWLVGWINVKQQTRLEIAQHRPARPAVVVMPEFENLNG